MIAGTSTVIMQVQFSAAIDGARLILVAEPSEELERFLAAAASLQKSGPRPDSVARPPAAATPDSQDQPIFRSRALLPAQTALAVSAPSLPPTLPVLALSKREREILRMVVQGSPNKEIARTLHRSERTIKTHLTAMFTKLGVDNRTQAAALAIQQGLI